MIKIEKTEVWGWEAAIRGMRNPKNSWDKTDSFWCSEEKMTLEEAAAKCNPCPKANNCDIYDLEPHFILGENDLKLMHTLAHAGPDHGKFLRMLNVAVDITAPLYWWKEFDTYKVGTVANSCSTMHKIHAKMFELDDFSHEHLLPPPDEATVFMAHLVDGLNFYRQRYLKTKDKKYWWQMIQLLPSSYNQKRTVQFNYAVLKSMYFARKNHKLDEWHTLCDWIEDLPYFREICL